MPKIGILTAFQRKDSIITTGNIFGFCRSGSMNIRNRIRKISGCFRSLNGAKMFARIRSYISTCKKNQINILVAIENAITGQPEMNFTAE